MKDFDTEIFIEDLAKYWVRKPTQVIHCGAHLAEEAEDYARNSFAPIIWIEAVPNLIPKLKTRLDEFPNDLVLEAALWSHSGIRKIMHISNNSFSSSSKYLGTHADTYPEIEFIESVPVVTSTLDSLDLSINCGALMVLDLQGIEYEVLCGAFNTLKDCSFVYVEVSKSELYRSQISWQKITDLLKTQGFVLVDWQYSGALNWGNALYSKESSRSPTAARLRRKLRHRLRRRATLRLN